MQPGRGRSRRVTSPGHGCRCVLAVLVSHGISFAERPVWDVRLVQQEQAQVGLAAGQPWEYFLQGKFHCLHRDCSWCLGHRSISTSPTFLLEVCSALPLPSWYSSLHKCVGGKGGDVVGALERTPAHGSVGPMALHFPAEPRQHPSQESCGCQCLLGSMGLSKGSFCLHTLLCGQ